MPLRPELSPRPSRWLAFCLLLFPLAQLLPWLGSFPFPPGEARFSDIVITHYPAAVTLKRLIMDYGQIPLWSPHLFSGAPLAANPLYSLYYPPAWLALLLPLPAGFNILVILHLVWGGLGLLRLLQAEGLRFEAALIGAISFTALPKLYAHYGAGHLTLLYAVPWTPWLLLAWKQAGLRLAGDRLHLGAGLILGLIFLADPRWAAYAGLLWLGYALYGLAGLPGARPHWQSIRRLVIQLALAALVAAPLALPLLEYTRLATRAQLSLADNLEFSLPVARLLGLLFPSLGGTHEYELYPGALVVLLAVLAGSWGAVRRRSGFWLLAFGISLLWALGENLPVFSWLAALPGFDLLRVPSRALFITGFALAALAAYAVHFLLSTATSDGSPAPRRLVLLLVALATFVVLLAGGAWFVTGQPNRALVWGAALLVVSALWVGLRLRGGLAPQLWLLGCLALVVLDLGIADRAAYSPHPSDQVLGEKAALVAYLQAQPGLFRVFSPSYSLPQQVSAAAGLENTAGVDPLQIQAYASFFARATGIPLTGYGVTLPPFASGDPSRDNQEAIPDASQLGLLNVAYVAAEYLLTAPDLKWIGEFDGTQLYRNTRALPRAWLQPASSPLGEDIQPVASLEWTPNRILASIEPAIETPAWLVFSEIAYPGWQALVDGQPATLEAAEGLLRRLSLEPGTRQVELRFRPSSIAAGLGLGALGLVLALLQARSAARLSPLNTQETAL